ALGCRAIRVRRRDRRPRRTGPLAKAHAGRGDFRGAAAANDPRSDPDAAAKASRPAVACGFRRIHVRPDRHDARDTVGYREMARLGSAAHFEAEAGRAGLSTMKTNGNSDSRGGTSPLIANKPIDDAIDHAVRM